MGEGNVDGRFFEAYRCVEIFLRDAYGGKGGDGVKRYLRQMRTSGMPTARGSAYARLKHWRYLRDEYAHERSGVCTEEDVAALEDFYIQLLRVEDPLTQAAGHTPKMAQRTANIPPPVLQQPSTAAPLPSATAMGMSPDGMEVCQTTPSAAAPPQAAGGVSSRETGAQSKSPRPMVRPEKRQGAGKYAAWPLLFGLLAALGGALLLYAVGYFLTR